MAATADLRTVSEVAEILKVHEKTVRRWISEGRIPVVRIGRLIRIDAAALDEFLAGSAA